MAKCHVITDHLYFCILCFVALKAPYKFIIRVALYGPSAQQFPNKNTRETNFAGALLNANSFYFFLHFFARDNSFRSSVLGILELQYAEIVPFFPLPICFFSYIAKLSGNDMRRCNSPFVSAWQSEPSGARLLASGCS